MLISVHNGRGVPAGRRRRCRPTPDLLLRPLWLRV